MTEPIAISPDPSEPAVTTPAARKSTNWGQSCTHNGLTMPLFAWLLNFGLQHGVCDCPPNDRTRVLKCAAVSATLKGAFPDVTGVNKLTDEKIAREINKIAKEIKQSLRTYDNGGDKNSPFTFRRAAVSGAVIDKVRAYIERAASVNETKIAKATAGAALKAEGKKSNQMYSASINTNYGGDFEGEALDAADAAKSDGDGDGEGEDDDVVDSGDDADDVEGFEDFELLNVKGKGKLGNKFGSTAHRRVALPVDGGGNTRKKQRRDHVRSKGMQYASANGTGGGFKVDPLVERMDEHSKERGRRAAEQDAREEERHRQLVAAMAGSGSAPGGPGLAPAPAQTETLSSRGWDNARIATMADEDLAKWAISAMGERAGGKVAEAILDLGLDGQTLLGTELDELKQGLGVSTLLANRFLKEVGTAFALEQ